MVFFFRSLWARFSSSATGGLGEKYLSHPSATCLKGLPSPLQDIWFTKENGLSGHFNLPSEDLERPGLLENF
jgi:hypothetical protein